MVRETTITPQRPLLVAFVTRVWRCDSRAVALVRVAAASFGRGGALGRRFEAVEVALDADVVPRFVPLADADVFEVVFFVVLLVPVVVLAADPWAPIRSAGAARHRSARRETTGSRRIKE